MLKKLLRYDFKSVFRYWWIAALSSLVLSIGGGSCLSILLSERELPTAVNVISVLALILVIFSYAAFSILTVILVFTRFYKNFFSDEGYLTFTLPVKRSSLLNSKLIMSTTTMVATMLVCILNVLVLLCIGFADEISKPYFWDQLSYLLKTVIDSLGFYCIIYVLEILILVVLLTVFSNLFLFCCITLASIITKKAKVITAIGIYYGANSVFSFFTQIFYMFGVASLSNWLTRLPAYSGRPIAALILLGVISFIAIFCSLLYTLQYWMIDRKLNLN